MAQVRVGGGNWMPSPPPLYPASSTIHGRSNFGALVNDQEETQYIGRVCLAGGAAGGSKTFGNSASAVNWLSGGGSVQLIPIATLRVGIKQSSSIDAANGPPARATIGAAAFDVYTDVAGSGSAGTSAVNSVTYYNTAMATLKASAISVSHGDLICVSFLLSKTSGTQLVNFSQQSNNGVDLFGGGTLVTAGPTYTTITAMPNIVLTFDDGSFGWLEPSWIMDAGTTTANVGNTNIFGNAFKLPFACKIDAVAGIISSAGTVSATMGVWDIDNAGSPSLAPSALSNGTVSVSPKIIGSAGPSWNFQGLPAEVSLSANHWYFVGLLQNSASNFGIDVASVNIAASLQAMGLDANCYYAKSTAGAAVVQQNSGKSRASFWVRVSSVDSGAGGGGGMRLAGHGGLAA